ncbi:MAG TPA: T9SS type A sorting domain-containing protein, partial [Saprospiraceae bacterium]|nr:T9SS type A sorting domain-containing protein [Saprospiraceae bacterium]
YNVTVTSANGCQDWTYRYWYSATSCTVDIFTYADSVPISNSAWLSVQPQGNWADWHIEWSTGETSSTILVTTGGEYCVSATNLINGCVATACTWVQPDSACYVQINSLSLDPVTLQLSAVGGPDPLSTYAWSTGETTPDISITENGYYGVTVTNTAGCTVSGYTFVYPANDLSVQVLLSDTTGTGNTGVFADIYLIQYDTAQGGILTAIDTVATYTWTNDWAFVNIQNIPAGQYLVKAALKPNSNGYATHLPTYYDDALLWSDATPVTVNAISGFYSNSTVYINLIPGQNPGGAGFIGGLVSQGANLTGGGDEAESLGEGDPFSGANVVLTLPDGTPVATAVTGASGQYSFANLAWGTYILTLDIPGLTPVSITVTIGPGQPSVTSANFKVDENSIALPVQDIFPDKPVKIFPNPAHDMLTIELPASAELTLTNAQGQIVQHTLENGAVTRLPLHDLPAGIYFLTARMANSIQVLKVMIE